MPCNSDYLNPTEKEKNKKQTAGLIVYVLTKLGKEPAPWIVEQSKNVYRQGVYNLNSLVVILYSTLKMLTVDKFEAIVYNAKDKTSRELANWWEEHEKADKKKEENERKQIADDKAKQKALAKLTDKEKKLLGLK